MRGKNKKLRARKGQEPPRAHAGTIHPPLLFFGRRRHFFFLVDRSSLACASLTRPMHTTHREPVATKREPTHAPAIEPQKRWASDGADRQTKPGVTTPPSRGGKEGKRETTRGYDARRAETERIRSKQRNAARLDSRSRRCTVSSAASLSHYQMGNATRQRTRLVQMRRHVESFRRNAKPSASPVPIGSARCHPLGEQTRRPSSVTRTTQMWCLC